jgi:hypothetical protein
MVEFHSRWLDFLTGNGPAGSAKSVKSTSVTFGNLLLAGFEAEIDEGEPGEACPHCGNDDGCLDGWGHAASTGLCGVHRGTRRPCWRSSSFQFRFRRLRRARHFFFECIRISRSEGIQAGRPTIQEGRESAPKIRASYRVQLPKFIHARVLQTDSRRPWRRSHDRQNRPCAEDAANEPKVDRHGLASLSSPLSLRA